MFNFLRKKKKFLPIYRTKSFQQNITIWGWGTMFDSIKEGEEYAKQHEWMHVVGWYKIYIYPKQTKT